MIYFIRMKQAEWKVKATLYKAVASIISQQKGILELLSKLYTALKDVPADELQKELVTKLAELIHEEEKQ